MNAKKEYKTVNSALEFFGEAPIPMPDCGTDEEKIRHLLDKYAERLKANHPQYRVFKKNTEIREMICMHLADVLAGKK